MVVSAGQPLVAAPTRTPLSYGLLSVSQTPVDTDEHWQLGVRYEPDACTPDEITFEVCPVTGSPEVKVATGSWSTRAANPVTVYAHLTCNPVGNWDDYEARLTRAFNSGEARAIEREFWTGENGLLPHLAEDTGVDGSGPFDSSVVLQTAATVITGGPVDITEAVGLLEEALASCYGHEGVLHVPPVTVAHLASKTLVEKDGPRLRSPMGHLVAAGAGYTGSSPAGAAPVGGVYWLYATGAIAVRRSALNVTSSKQAALDRSRNSMVYVAERTYVIGWDCCHFAVPVRLGGDVTGAVGGST